MKIGHGPSTVAAWGDPNKMKNVDAEDVEEYLDEKDGRRKKRWAGRNSATVDPASGKAYLAVMYVSRSKPLNPPTER